MIVESKYPRMSTTSRMASARHFFSRQGTLSKWHPNYEYRPGQLEMAEAVESALKDRKHLIAEAGTGTGKTLAYLVPAILSGRRIVVSTGTKNLQEQLFFKDIPFLQQHFERCFLTLMHQRAAESDVIIVNHHLFFADLALKDEEYAGGILPEYHAVVFDEAHELEDVAGQYFGVSVSSYRFDDLRRDISV